MCHLICISLKTFNQALQQAARAQHFAWDTPEHLLFGFCNTNLVFYRRRQKFVTTPFCFLFSTYTTTVIPSLPSYSILCAFLHIFSVHEQTGIAGMRGQGLQAEQDLGHCCIVRTFAPTTTQACISSVFRKEHMPCGDKTCCSLSCNMPSYPMLGILLQIILLFLGGTADRQGMAGAEGKNGIHAFLPCQPFLRFLFAVLG